MIVYHYHPETGVYNHVSSEADPDPMEPGKWLIPAHATKLLPPHVADSLKQHAVFNGFKWTVENIPMPPALHTNLKNYDPDLPHGLWPRLTIKEALKGGIS